MPNPYINNTDAAFFVDYYGSKRMLQDSTNRLYKGGVQRRKEAVEQAEREAYQPPPTVRRSKEEIDAYLRARVDEELLRRRQHRAALAREMYPEVEEAPKYLSPEQFEKHVKHVYTDPMRRRQLREREIERVFGKKSHPVSPTRGTSPRSTGDAQRRSDSKDKEPWRPASLRPSYNDGQQYLVAQYEYSPDPKKSQEVLIRCKTANRAPNYNRLNDLSRPLRITPPTVTESDDNARPPFHVSRKMSYGD